MTEEELKKLTLDDIVRWVIHNSTNPTTMDKINRLTFTFTTKYKRFSEPQMTPEMEKAGREAGFIK